MHVVVDGTCGRESSAAGRFRGREDANERRKRTALQGQASECAYARGRSQGNLASCEVKVKKR